MTDEAAKEQIRLAKKGHEEYHALDHLPHGGFRPDWNYRPSQEAYTAGVFAYFPFGDDDGAALAWIAWMDEIIYERQILAWRRGDEDAREYHYLARRELRALGRRAGYLYAGEPYANKWRLPQ